VGTAAVFVYDAMLDDDDDFDVPAVPRQRRRM
jgi:hypothetical protein